MKNNMEAILRIINSDPELKAKFETTVDNYCNSREWQLILAWKTKKHNLTGDQMEALTFALEWADIHPHWISGEDKPRENGFYLCYSDKEKAYEILSLYGADWYDAYGHYIPSCDVTHWMPLPSIEHLKEKEL